MIRAKAGDVILLGLEPENITRLQRGQPIHVDLNELGGASRVVIFTGESREAMARTLAKSIGADEAETEAMAAVATLQPTEEQPVIYRPKKDNKHS